MTASASQSVMAHAEAFMANLRSRKASRYAAAAASAILSVAESHHSESARISLERRTASDFECNNAAIRHEDSRTHDDDRADLRHPFRYRTTCRGAGHGR